MKTPVTGMDSQDWKVYAPPLDPASRAFGCPQTDWKQTDLEDVRAAIPRHVPTPLRPTDAIVYFDMRMRQDVWRSGFLVIDAAGRILRSYVTYEA